MLHNEIEPSLDSFGKRRRLRIKRYYFKRVEEIDLKHEEILKDMVGLKDDVCLKDESSWKKMVDSDKGNI